MKDLGWANSWREEPKIVKECKRLKHNPSDIDRSQGRGLDHVVICTICDYIYHYDSS